MHLAKGDKFVFRAPSSAWRGFLSDGEKFEVIEKKGDVATVRSIDDGTTFTFTFSKDFVNIEKAQDV